MNHSRRKGAAQSVPNGILTGLAIGISIVLGGSVLLAKLLNEEYVQWESAGYWILAMILLASFADAMTSCGRIKRRRLGISLISGAVLWVTLLIATALLFGGQYQGIGVTGGLILAGSISAGLLGLKQKKGIKGIKQ